MSNPFDVMLKDIAVHTLAGFAYLEKMEERILAKIKTDVLDPIRSELASIEEKMTAGISDEAKAAVAALGAKIESLTVGASADHAPSASLTAPVVTSPTPTTTVTVVPAAATSAAVDPATGVSTDPGMTSHHDTASQVTTVVPHDGSEPTATDATGSAVTPSPVAVAAAVQATAAAGVTVPGA